jgi:hypothetical protein
MKCADYNLPPCYECNILTNRNRTMMVGLMRSGNCALNDIKSELDDASDDEGILKFVIKNYATFHDGLLAPHAQKIVELFYPQYSQLIEITMLLK